ncbi:MAG: rcc01693 family protein [Rhodoblastus sp.]
MIRKNSRKSREKFPWSEAMRFGLGVLRLSSRDFWTMTPREIHAASQGLFGAGPHGEPISREKLDALMRAFPDR